MYIRIVRGQPQPGQVEEVAKRWQEHLAPRLREIPGFRAGYLIGEPQGTAAIGVTIWDDKPGEALTQAMGEFRQRIQDIASGPPSIEDYEVLAEA